MAQPALSFTEPVIRPARPEDIPDLLRIEDRAFETDRLTRRNFQHLLTRAHAKCLVAEQDGALVGYALVLLRRGTSLARLYSLAVDPDQRGMGTGRLLLRAAEAAAQEEDALFLRLEVRTDNEAAISLYQREGYRTFGRYLDYYEDHAEALRLEKRLAPVQAPTDFPVPYYPQTTDFTCGPCALMMVMRALDPALVLDRQLEIRIWREATTIYMTSGPGGCDPYGLALAAHKRGFSATVHVSVSDDQLLFLEGVRSEKKKEVMRLAQEELRREVAETDIDVIPSPLSWPEMTGLIDRGVYPIVLISLYRMYREKAPHWIVVHGYDDRYIYTHDPLIDPDDWDIAADKINMPIPRWEFERMARYGKTQLRAAVIVERRS
ncbi:MAG TPA: peptidase C39 family protein [Alphaproteobacteria bacterium]|nr:peptidase C39 family protein [Alphaproteobacteria bacterium]